MGLVDGNDIRKFAEHSVRSLFRGFGYAQCGKVRIGGSRRSLNEMWVHRRKGGRIEHTRDSRAANIVLFDVQVVKGPKVPEVGKQAFTSLLGKTTDPHPPSVHTEASNKDSEEQRVARLLLACSTLTLRDHDTQYEADAQHHAKSDYSQRLHTRHQAEMGLISFRMDCDDQTTLVRSTPTCLLLIGLLFWR